MIVEIQPEQDMPFTLRIIFERSVSAMGVSCAVLIAESSVTILGLVDFFESIFPNARAVVTAKKIRMIIKIVLFLKIDLKYSMFSSFLA